MALLVVVRMGLLCSNSLLDSWPTILSYLQPTYKIICWKIRRVMLVHKSLSGKFIGAIGGGGKWQGRGGGRKGKGTCRGGGGSKGCGGGKGDRVCFICGESYVNVAASLHETGPSIALGLELWMRCWYPPCRLVLSNIWCCSLCGILFHLWDGMAFR